MLRSHELSSIDEEAGVFFLDSLHQRKRSGPDYDELENLMKLTAGNASVVRGYGGLEHNVEVPLGSEVVLHCHHGIVFVRQVDSSGELPRKGTLLCGDSL